MRTQLRTRARVCRLVWEIACWRFGVLLPTMALALSALLLVQCTQALVSLTAAKPPGDPALASTHDVESPSADSLAADPMARAARGKALHDLLGALVATGGRLGLDWPQAEYRREQTDGGELVRWRVSQRQRMDEQRLRKALLEVLHEHPSVSLDRLKIERDRESSADVVAHLDWSLWVANVGTIHPAAEGTPPNGNATALPRVWFARAHQGKSAPTFNEPTTTQVDSTPVPSLPFRLVGRQKTAEGELWFLERDGHVLIAREGDALDEQYRLEQVEPRQLWLQHLPSGTRQSLSTEMSP